MRTNYLITFIIVVSGLFIASSIQAQQQTTARKGPFVENDTTFVYKYDDSYKAYIETNHQSTHYQRILHPIMNEYDIKTYEDGMKTIKEIFPQSLPKFPIGDLPRQWIPIRSFKGKYYLTSESCFQETFTDSILIRVDMEGPRPQNFLSFKKLSPHHYYYQIKDYAYRDGKVEEIHLYMIDPKRQIIVIQSGSGYCNMLISKEKAPLLDMICWISEDMPDDSDIDFDTIDFQKLIAPFKKAPHE